MNQLHKTMNFRIKLPPRPSILWAALALFSVPHLNAVEGAFTRVYMLKNNDANVVIQVLKFATADTSGKRIISGAGRKLVITDIAEKQEEIATLLPIIDLPPKETEPPRIKMEMIVRVTNHLNKQAKAASTPAPAANAASPSTGDARTYDIRKSTGVYKSIYSDEDSIITRKPRVFREDPPLPATSNLKLKGIFLFNTNAPMALLTFESVTFTARNGRLYHNNKTVMKDITTRILKDRVIVTGPDRIPREIKFSSTL